MTEVKVPTLGESITEATLGEWLKQPGDAIAVDEPIASLETDNVSVEVPSPVAGVMGEHKVAVGDTVEVGAVIGVVEERSEEHTSELQSLMRISYAVFCLKTKNNAKGIGQEERK